MQHLTASELASWLADPQRPAPVLLDVREPWEFETCHLEQARPIPMREVPARIAEIDPEVPVVCICHHGARSMQVAMFLNHQGHGEVYNLTGGVDAWAREVDPAFPRY